MEYKTPNTYSVLQVNEVPPALQSAPSPAVAHGGNHAICFNAGNPRTRVAPQDRAALRKRGGLGRG